MAKCVKKSGLSLADDPRMRKMNLPPGTGRKWEDKEHVFTRILAGREIQQRQQGGTEKIMTAHLLVVVFRSGMLALNPCASVSIRG
jgi:hypothetical protein